jgi:HAD superfamily hydrolase (TIGR01509 family)
MVASKRAVLFDLAGTLVSMSIFDDHDRAVAREFARVVGLDESQDEMVLDNGGSTRPAQKIFKQQFYRFRDLFAGRYSHAARSLGVELDESDAVRLSEMWWKGCSARFGELGLQGGGLRSGAVDTLRALREHGFHIGLVSNIDESDLQDFLAVDGFGGYFDSHISSEAARSCKPDAAIFSIALEQSGCRADEVIFVGDIPSQDIDGAAAAGMQAVLIEGEFEMAVRKMESTHHPDHEISELPELLELLV